MPQNAEAGRKRIQKLVYSRKWNSDLLPELFWRRGERRVAAGEQAGETLLAIWDESVLEKPESLQLENLSPVRSSKAVRLKRIKPGYFNPPGGRPIFVPGFHWLEVLVCGLRGPVTPSQVRFWTTRGTQATTKREEEGGVLREAAQRWWDRVIHVFDRGFAGSPWLGILFVHAVRFVIRWPKDYTLIDENGQRKKAWRSPRGNAPGLNANCGMRAATVNAKWGWWPSRSVIPPITSPCGWWSLAKVLARPPGTC